MKISLLHAKLKAYLNWPIPYWLTPIGILLMVGMWNGFNWKLNTESWPFWLWALDKLITIITIIGAALLAQYVLNKNAQMRESRDRRLKACEHLLEYVNITGDLYVEFLKSNHENATELLSQLNVKNTHISSYGKLYLPDVYEITLKLHDHINEIKEFKRMRLAALRYEFSLYLNDYENLGDFINDKMGTPNRYLPEDKIIGSKLLTQVMLTIVAAHLRIESSN
jgi:hypothetical protein